MVTCIWQCILVRGVTIVYVEIYHIFLYAWFYSAFIVFFVKPEFTFVDGDGLVPAESAMVLSLASK